MAGARAYALGAPTLATGGIMLPVPTSGSKDWAKAGSAMTLAKVARVTAFFIAVSVFVGTEARLRAFSPSIVFFC